MPLLGDLLERQAPHRGIRIADQGHRRRRGGVARRALRLADFEKIAQAALEVIARSFGDVSASGGSRFDGTAFKLGGRRDRGLYLRERVLHRRVVRVNVAPVGVGAAVIVSAGAAGPRPTGVGTNTSSATPTQTATAVTAPPSARLRLADRRKGAANRNGFSMKRSVSTASPPETKTAANAPATAGGPAMPMNPARPAAPASATDTTSTTPGRPLASVPLPGCGRIPAWVSHSRRRSPAPCPARATARRYPDRAWTGPTGCRPAGSGPALPIR